MGHGFSYYFQQGGIAVYPLLLFSVLGVAVALERAYYLLRAWHSLKEVHPRVQQFVKAGKMGEARELARGQFLCGIYDGVLEKEGLTEEVVLRRAERRRSWEVQQLKRRIWILGTIGSLAPFVGLFGTVVGIMHAFGEIARTQEGGFSTVSAGISEALIATAAGLLIGVLSVLAYNFFSQRINQISFELKNLVEELTENLELSSITEADLELARRK